MIPPLPRVALLDAPTPVRSGYTKDADAPARALEWLLGDAQARGRTRLITVGSATSAWATTASASARAFGIDVRLAPSRWSLPWAWLRHRCPRVIRVDSPLGAVGAVMLALEIGDQVRAGELPAPARILAPAELVAGLVVGVQVAGLPSRVVAVGGGDADRIAVLAQRCARRLRRHGAPLGVLDLGDDAFDLADPGGDGPVLTLEADDLD